MSFAFEEVKDAYIRLKSYIYYDNTDILLRRQLVEFETNTTKDGGLILFRVNNRSNKRNIIGLKPHELVEEKIIYLTEQLNNYHNDSVFINKLLDEIKVNFYPKKYKEVEQNENFITNKRIQSEYPLERATAFIEAPIEFHIISVLWIIKFGVDLDLELNDYCLGNRLLLNKDKKKLVQGSGLFKPYFKQYQKWRDDSVKVAKELLDKDKDVLFLNLDIKDYFHSVRVPVEKIFEGRKHKSSELQASYSLKEVLLKIHLKYTELVSKKYEVPCAFYKDLEGADENQLKEVILPIGFLSSYILANDYLKKFDKAIIERIKPAYYGRYVDDILIVISDPNPHSDKDENNLDLKFSFKNYKSNIIKKKDPLLKISFKESDLTELEVYVLSNFSPIINLVDSPFKQDYSKDTGRVFKLNGYKSLFCQSEKSLVYYFQHEESDLVIDKLKKELDEKTSEFRDLPSGIENENEFEMNAYHLQYQGSDGKIRTLKDYKENRYGLTVYLSNKIFSALRHEKKISEKEKDQILKFFKGYNCIIFYRLWERIFTFFLVNDHPSAYVDFYLHCAEQIDKIKHKNNKYVDGTMIEYSFVVSTLVEYLDCSHEIAISLNPSFISKTNEEKRNFEFKINEVKNSSFSFFFSSFEPTKPDSFWVKRFRRTNMIRHQYIVNPLLSYTKGVNKWTNLVGLNFDINSYKLDNDLIANSPRPVKFWECCLAVAFQEISNYKKTTFDSSNDSVATNLLGPYIIESNDPEIEEDYSQNRMYLDDAYDLYIKANQNHIPEYILGDLNHKHNFFKINYGKLDNAHTSDVHIQEITVNSKAKLSEPSISFANTEVKEKNIINSLRGDPNLTIDRYQKLVLILKKARLEKSDILLFPEFFIPINLLSSLVRFSEKNQTLQITGLEHVTVDNTSFNFVISILPVEVNGVKDATVIFRLKNHYAHIEEHLIRGNHFNVPKPSPYRYDIINWRNIYFSIYYCFELANVMHRSLLKGKIDLLIGVEWNKDTSYFSNIVETCTRDLHAYVAQVNTSHYGDTRLTQPVETARKDILRLKGGENDTILVAKINLSKLREFQRKKFSLTHDEKEFKPLPPDYLLEDVMKRINNKNVL